MTRLQSIQFNTNKHIAVFIKCLFRSITLLINGPKHMYLINYTGLIESYNFKLYILFIIII